MMTPNNVIPSELETDQVKEVAAKIVAEVQEAAAMEDAAMSEEGGEGTKGSSSTAGGDRP